ncbi:MAG: DUF2799 domain-containing protein [Rhodocyclaceae bacterium]
MSSLRRVTSLFSVVTVSAILSGCATIPAEQCASMNWNALGMEDGRSGHAASRLDLHRDACRKVQVEPDARAWESGRKAGLKQYCQLPNAIERGLARDEYEQVCSDPNFARLYTAARRVADARHQVEYSDSQIDMKERELLTNKSLSDKRRGELMAEVRSLQRNRNRASEDRFAAERDLDHLRRELSI